MIGNHTPRSARRAPAATAARAALFAALALAASGCSRYTKPEAVEVTASVSNDYRLRHPIAVREGERAVEVFVGTNFGGLNAGQRADMMAFALAWKREATGGIIVEVPAGTRNARAAHGALGEVRSILTAAGVPRQAVRVRSYQPTDPGMLATLRVVYPKMTASAGPCGFWPHDLGPTNDRWYNENRPYWNLGCATQRNLAAVVENPADLVQPRGEVPVMASRRGTVLDKYRKGESTATVYPNTNQGKISDVGQ